MVSTIYIPLILLQTSCLLINGQLFASAPAQVPSIKETQIISAVPPPISPCPNLFQYLYTQNAFIGKLTIAPPGEGRLEPIVVRVELSVAARLPTSYFGSIQMTENAQVAVRKLMNNSPISYHIYFPIISPLPRVTRIHLNGRLICSGAAEPLVPGGTVTTINLDHTFTPFQFTVETPPVVLAIPPLPAIQSKPFVSATQPTLVPARNPPIFIPKNPSVPEIESQGDCGIVYSSNSLIIGGSTVKQRNGYPWIVAIFQRHGNKEYYYCQGSLLSKHYVVTAAHCMTRRPGGFNSKEDLILYLGKYNLDDRQEHGAQRLEVKSIFIQSDFQGAFAYADSDIAIIETSTEADFDRFVQPVCLWPKRSPDINILYRQHGTFVGWGVVDDSGYASTTPMVADIPVVPPNECRKLFPKGYDLKATERTFCAGSRNGTIPCYGDSGGGLVFKDEPIGGTSRWYLRGVLSQTLRPGRNITCKTDDYVIFTDVAIHSDWISQFIAY